MNEIVTEQLCNVKSYVVKLRSEREGEFYAKEGNT